MIYGIFDMDGLLFDTETMYQTIWQAMARKRNIILPENFKDTICGTSGDVMKRLLETYYEENDGGSIRDEWRTLALKELAKHVPLKPGAIDILTWFHTHGKTALASSSNHAMVMNNVTKTNTLSLLDAIVCGDEVTKGKPEPDIFLKAAEKINASPKDCYVFEDSINGILAAKRAGMKGIMIPDLMQPTEEIISLADGIYPSLTDALDAIRAHEV